MTTVPEEISLPTLRSPLKVSAFAHFIGVSRVTAYRMIRAGEVRAIKIRGCTMIAFAEARRIAEQGTRVSQE